MVRETDTLFKILNAYDTDRNFKIRVFFSGVPSESFNEIYKTYNKLDRFTEQKDVMRL
jgi:hypothetical protein